MLVKYTIHRVGTPKIALINHWTYDMSEYWNKERGWSHKSLSTVYEDKDNELPDEGEWVEIYINEPVRNENEN